MSIKLEIKDGEGTSQTAKVDKTGPLSEKSLWVHLAGSTAEFVLPTTPAPIPNSENFDSFLLNGASEQMAIDGSTTPVDFRIDADATQDIVITQLVFAGQDGSIKFSKWFGFNSPLTNGVALTLKSDNVSATFPVMKTTTRLMAFSSGNIENASVTGEAVVVSFRQLDPPIVIRAQGTHGVGNDDFIQVRIQDSLTGMDDFTCVARGYKVDAGLF